MRVFDCFPFFNELDLLELRLNELWDVVDVFVITEARQSFVGDPKPLNFKENEERFAKYASKIRYVVIEAFPEELTSWGKDGFQRDELVRGLTDVEPDDIVMLSDLDEIPRASVVRDIAAKGIEPRQVYCLSLSCYCYYLNVDVKVPWERHGPRLIRGADIPQEFYAVRKVTAPHKRALRNLTRQIKSSRRIGFWVRRVLVKNAGWHFTWMGGAEAVALKGSSLAVHATVDETPKSVEWAKERIAASFEDKDGYEIVEIDDHFPAYLRENTERYAKYILS